MVSLLPSSLGWTLLLLLLHALLYPNADGPYITTANIAPEHRGGLVRKEGVKVKGGNPAEKGNSVPF